MGQESAEPGLQEAQRSVQGKEFPEGKPENHCGRKRKKGMHLREPYSIMGNAGAILKLGMVPLEILGSFWD